MKILQILPILIISIAFIILSTWALNKFIFKNKYCVFGIGCKDDKVCENFKCVDPDTPPSGYNCVAGACVASTSGAGTYATLDACNAACGTSPPVPSGYNCVSDTCVASTSGAGTYATLDACNVACQPTQTKYRCDGANCIVDPQGIYTDPNCNNECGGGGGDPYKGCNDYSSNFVVWPQDKKGVDMINSMCPCKPSELINSGTDVGTNNSLYFSSGIGPANTKIGMNIMNTCDRPLYIITSSQVKPGKNIPRYLLINQKLEQNTLYRFYFENEELIALVCWIFYFTDSGDLIQKGLVPQELLDSKVGDQLNEFGPDVPGIGEPGNPGPYLRIEASIGKNPNDPTKVTCGGNISYVDQTTMPALAQFGPGPVRDVDSGADINSKLLYTTCTPKQLMDGCPTILKTAAQDGDYGMCVAPQHLCKLPEQFDIARDSDLYTKYCSPSKGLMCPIINAFNLKYGTSGIDPKYFNAIGDRDFSTPEGNGLPISGIIYGESNPFGGIYTIDKPLEPFFLPSNPSLFMANPDCPPTSNVGCRGQDLDQKQYLFKSDEDAYQTFVGTIKNGGIEGYSGTWGGSSPPSNDIKIKAFNTVNNSWAVARGMCDPENPTTNCGGTNGDYFVKDMSFDPGYIKSTANLENPDNWYRNKKFPHNPYSKYVTEHTNMIYGFPYDEGEYGGFSSTTVDTTQYVPQMNVVVCPKCETIDISSVNVQEVTVPLIS